MSAFLPLIPGARWRYVARYKGREIRETRVLKAAGVPDERAYCFVVDKELDTENAIIFGNMYGLGVYANTAEGLMTWPAFFLRETVAVDPSMGQLLLKDEPAVGDAVSLDTNSSDRRGPFTVMGFETVTVPAGTFEGCLKVDMGRDDSVAWLAPGVGLVKWVMTTGRVEELEGFELES